jgi:hypothetical protein
VTIPDTVGVSLLTNAVCHLIVPHAPRGNASTDALRRNRMTVCVMGGVTTRWVNCLNVD